MIKSFNPNLFMSIIRFSNLAADENDYLDGMANEALKETAQIDKDAIRYDAAAFEKHHIAIRRRMIRSGIESLLGSLTGFEFKHIEKVIELTDKPTGAAVILPRDIKAYKSYNRLIITKNIVKNDKKCYYKLKYDCENKIPDEDTVIHICSKKAGEIGDVRKDKQTVFIDKSKLLPGWYIGTVQMEMFFLL